LDEYSMVSDNSKYKSKDGRASVNRRVEVKSISQSSGRYLKCHWGDMEGVEWKMIPSLR